MPAATYSKYTHSQEHLYCYPTAYEAVHHYWSGATCIFIFWREISVVYVEEVISTFGKHIAILKETRQF